MQDILEHNLSFNSRLFSDRAEEITLDMGQVIGLLNGLKEDPVGISTTLLRIMTAIKSMAAEINRDKETARIERERIFDERNIITKSTDPEVNPHAGLKLKTAGERESLVRYDDKYKEADDAYQHLKYLTSLAYNLAEVVTHLFEMAKGLVLNPDEIPASGTVIDPEEIKDLVQQFVNNVKK